MTGKERRRFAEGQIQPLIFGPGPPFLPFSPMSLIGGILPDKLPGAFFTGVFIAMTRKVFSLPPVPDDFRSGTARSDYIIYSPAGMFKCK